MSPLSLLWGSSLGCVQNRPVPRARGAELREAADDMVRDQGARHLLGAVEHLAQLGGAQRADHHVDCGHGIRLEGAFCLLALDEFFFGRLPVYDAFFFGRLPSYNAFFRSFFRVRLEGAFTVLTLDEVSFILLFRVRVPFRAPISYPSFCSAGLGRFSLQALDEVSFIRLFTLGFVFPVDPQ